MESKKASRFQMDVNKSQYPIFVLDNGKRLVT